MTGDDATRPSSHRRLGHDIAGEAYPTGRTPPLATPSAARGAEPVASRSTDEVARDIVAIRRAKRGDTGAFADLVRSNDADVRALVWALTGTDELDLLCTQVYLRAFRGLPLAPTKSPRIWLLGIADGTARDTLRRRDRHRGQGTVASAPVPLDMPDDQRLALAAVSAVGLTSRETARLIEGGVEHTRELLDAARAHPDLTLPFDPVPDHRPGFWDELGRRLLIERSQPAASTPRDARRGRTITIGSSPDPQSADVARGMAARIEQQNPGSFPWRKLGLGVAILVSVVALVGVAVSLAHRASTRDAGLGETAAKTLDLLDEALASDTVVRGVAEIDGSAIPGFDGHTVRFVRTNTGSWQNTSQDGAIRDGYDVPTSSFATVRSAAPGGPVAEVHAGVAPGPPLPTATTDDGLGDLLAEAIRIVRRGSNGSVTTRTVTPPTTASGSETERLLWVVTSRLDGPPPRIPLAGTGVLSTVDADEAELIADRSLALPTRLTLRRQGRVVAKVQFSDLAISSQKADASHAPDASPDARITRTDGGFETTTLDAVSDWATTAAPAYVPAGYVLTATAADDETRTVVLCYRNGSRQLVVTGRAATAPGGIGDGADVKTADISSGAMAGRTARTVDEPLGLVEVADSTTRVTVTGDPPVSELVKVVASLR